MLDSVDHRASPSWMILGVSDQFHCFYIFSMPLGLSPEMVFFSFGLHFLFLLNFPVCVL